MTATLPVTHCIPQPSYTVHFRNLMIMSSVRPVLLSFMLLAVSISHVAMEVPTGDLNEVGNRPKE